MLIRNTVLVCLSASTLLAAPGVLAQTQAASTTLANRLPEPDRQFVQAASSSGSTEIDAAKIVLSRSADRQVKSFARQMMLDHTRLTLELKLAAPHGVTVPKDNSDEAVLASLRSVPAAGFDRLYLSKVAVKGHEAAVAAFQAEIANGQNADLKRAAQKALPTIEHHYQMARDLAAAKGVVVH
jgi:predicted outer membrane protein